MIDANSYLNRIKSFAANMMNRKPVPMLDEEETVGGKMKNLDSFNYKPEKKKTYGR